MVTGRPVAFELVLFGAPGLRDLEGAAPCGGHRVLYRHPMFS